MWTLKCDTNEPIHKTETDSQREQACDCQGGGRERDRPGIWGQKMQSSKHRIDKQQGPTV